MATQLIQLKNGLMVEAEMPGEAGEQIAEGIRTLGVSFEEKVKPLLLEICEPFASQCMAGAQQEDERGTGGSGNRFQL